MHLIVKRENNPYTELRFEKGPIYIGRQMGSQVFLPDRSISRQHAVIYNTTDGDWVVEDLDSVNKTYLNDEAVHKSNLKDGDIIKISDFTLELFFKREPEGAKISLDDTLTMSLSEPKEVIRTVKGSSAPMLRLPVKRLGDMLKVSRELAKANDQQKFLKSLLGLLISQFRSAHVWVGFCDQPGGEINIDGGRQIDMRTVSFSDIALGSRIKNAMDSKDYILIQKMPLQMKGVKFKSAMIVPIMANQDCLGVIYIDNALEHEAYTMVDLDYLLIISVSVAALFEKLQSRH